jgi:hypothetical protein
MLGFHPTPRRFVLASGRADVFNLVVIDEDPCAFATNPFYGRRRHHGRHNLHRRRRRIHLTVLGPRIEVLEKWPARVASARWSASDRVGATVPRPGLPHAGIAEQEHDAQLALLDDIEGLIEELSDSAALSGAQPPFTLQTH